MMPEQDIAQVTGRVDYQEDLLDLNNVIKNSENYQQKKRHQIIQKSKNAMIPI